MFKEDLGVLPADVIERIQEMVDGIVGANALLFALPTVDKKKSELDLMILIERSCTIEDVSRR